MHEICRCGTMAAVYVVIALLLFSLGVAGYLLGAHVESELPHVSPESSDSEVELDSEHNPNLSGRDSADNPEGMRKRPCRCGQCLSVGRKRARLSE